MKILVACPNGAGTSLMMKIRIQTAVKALNISVEKLEHSSISEGKNIAYEYDVVFCPKNFVNMFKDAEKQGVKICGMKNCLSDQEAKQLLIATGLVVEK